MGREPSHKTLACVVMQANKTSEREESLPVEPGRLPVFNPHPHSCLLMSTEQTASGVPGKEVSKLSAKSGEKFVSEKQQKQAKIQKLSSLDQWSGLCKGKSCLI